MSERECDCSSERDWEEVGSAWLCTCAGDRLREETVAPGSKRAAVAFQDYSDRQLMAKILEIYPKIFQHNRDFSLSFNARKNAYVLDFRKGRHELPTHLEKKDADECMANIKCVYLGVQVGQFIRNFVEEEIVLTQL